MRTSMAVIKLVLRTNKKLSSGEHPIMLRVSWHGIAEMSTGYSSSKTSWDKVNLCLKKSYPSYLVINQTLREMVRKATEKRDTFIRDGIQYTPKMILSVFNEPVIVNPLEVSSLIDQYISSRGIPLKNWLTVKNSLMVFGGKGLMINDIDEAFCRRYSIMMKQKGYSPGTIRQYLSKVGALCHYSIGLGLTSVHPFSSWHYNRDFRESKSELYIPSRTMDVMIDVFISSMIDGDRDGLWSYRENVFDDIIDPTSSLFALYLYIAQYHLCGLAPIDLLQLRKKDLKVVDIKGISCWAIDGHRSKTGVGYKIRLRRDDILTRLIIDTMLMFNNTGEYLLPCLNEYNGKSIAKKISNVYTYCTPKLIDWFRSINEEIVRRNVDGGDDIPLIDLDCRYYSARHSFIMKELMRPDVNLLKLATVTGKSVSSIHEYLTMLSDNDLL